MAQLIGMIFYMFSLIVLARVLMSWVQTDPYHPVAQFIYNTTEPFLKPIRDLMPPASGLDFSPVILMVILFILSNLLMGI